MVKFILKILILIVAVIAFLYFFDISFKNRGVEINYRKGGELKKIQKEVGKMGEKAEDKVKQEVHEVGNKVENKVGDVRDKAADKIKSTKEKAGGITDADRKKLENIIEKKTGNR